MWDGQSVGKIGRQGGGMVKAGGISGWGVCATRAYTAQGRSYTCPAFSLSSSLPAAPPFLAASVPPTYCIRPCSCTSAGAIRAPGRNGAAEASARASIARYNSVPLRVVVEDDCGLP